MTNKTSSKLVSVLLTVFVIGMLLMAGPANAVSVTQSAPSDASPTQGDTTTFDVEVKVSASENLPVDTIELVIDGNTCLYDVNGAFVSGPNICSGFTVQQTSAVSEFSSNRNGNGYGFGAGYGYGYGYGYGAGTNSLTALKYKVTWNTNGYAAKSYTIKTNVNVVGTSSYTFSSSEMVISVEAEPSNGNRKRVYLGELERYSEPSESEEPIGSSESSSEPAAEGNQNEVATNGAADSSTADNAGNLLTGQVTGGLLQTPSFWYGTGVVVVILAAFGYVYRRKIKKLF